MAEPMPHTEQEAIRALFRLRPRSNLNPGERGLNVARCYARRFPDSAPLALMEGFFEHWGGTAIAAKKSFRRALRLNPQDPEAWESMGALLDLEYNDHKAAQKFLTQAISLGGSIWSYHILARILAEEGRAQEALAVLSKGRCPYWRYKMIVEMREEIRSGLWEPDEAG